MLFAAHLPNHLNESQLFLVGAMGKVEANNIHPRAHQIAKHRLRIGSGTERGDDLRTAWMGLSFRLDSTNGIV